MGKAKAVADADLFPGLVVETRPAPAKPGPTRQQLMDAGKVWHLYRRDHPDTVIAERSSRSQCLAYLKEKGQLRAWRNGKSELTFCRVICENLLSSN